MDNPLFASFFVCGNKQAWHTGYNLKQTNKAATMNTTNHTLGQSVYIDDVFQGIYVDVLSNPLMSQQAVNHLVNQPRHGIYHCAALSGSPDAFRTTEYFGLRTVYSDEFGRVEQALVRTIDGTGAWVNLPYHAVLCPDNTPQPIQ